MTKHFFRWFVYNGLLNIIPKKKKKDLRKDYVRES